MTLHAMTSGPFPPCGEKLGSAVGAEGALANLKRLTNARCAGAPVIPTPLPQGENG